jgi:hypothetical protein
MEQRSASRRTTPGTTGDAKSRAAGLPWRAGGLFRVPAPPLAAPAPTTLVENVVDPTRRRNRAERQICDTKTTGLANLPSHSFAINRTWLQLALIAHDLLAWTRLLALDGDLATAEPKRLRYCLFHTAGHIVTTGRRRICRLSAWRWTTNLVGAFIRVHTLPLQT